MLTPECWGFIYIGLAACVHWLTARSRPGLLHPAVGSRYSVRTWRVRTDLTSQRRPWWIATPTPVLASPKNAAPTT